MGVKICRDPFNNATNNIAHTPAPAPENAVTAMAMEFDPFKGS